MLLNISSSAGVSAASDTSISSAPALVGRSSLAPGAAAAAAAAADDEADNDDDDGPSLEELMKQMKQI